MSKAVELLKREPVRMYLYGVLAAVLVLLVSLGVVDNVTAPLILAVVASVLGVEGLRSQVSPAEKPEK